MRQLLITPCINIIRLFSIPGDGLLDILVMAIPQLIQMITIGLKV